MSGRDFFDLVYDTTEPAENRKLYDEWAATYDRDLLSGGYATPARCAAALARVARSLDGAVLDYGCGTGISGMALRAKGFTRVDGCDISPGMLKRARQRGVYDRVWQIEPVADLPPEFANYEHITAVGVISVGAAPAETLDRLFGLLPQGGTITFSFNDHTIENDSYDSRLRGLVGSGEAVIDFKAYGEHLPKIGMGSMVYVLTRT